MTTRNFNGSLPNGVELYTCLNPDLKTFCLALWVRRGAMHDGFDEVGLAHFLEHATFRAISEGMGGGLYRTLYERGLDFDACTFDAYVRFEMRGPTEAFALGLDILLKVLEPPALSVEGMHRERLRIQAEIRENDSENSYDQFLRARVWRGTPLCRTIEGSVNAANRVSFDMLRREHAAWFGRGGFFFSCAGNVPDLDRLKARLSEIHPGAPVKAPVPAVPEGFFHRDAAVHWDAQRAPHLIFGFDVDASHFSPVPLNLMQDWLLSDNGALYLALSEDTGLAYGIDGYLQHCGGVAGLSFDFSVEPRRIEEAVAQVVDALNRAKALDDDALLAHRRGFVSVERQRLDDPSAAAFDWGFENGMLGCGWEDAEQRFAAYDAVSSEALREVFRAVFTPDNATLCALGSPRRVREEALRKILLRLRND